MDDVINSFPGYKCIKMEDGFYHNFFRGTDVGRGGYVYAEPGIYTDVALLDVRNMHGESIVRLNKFGEHTKKYVEIREARNAIKAHNFDKARTMLGGKLAKYLDDEQNADQLSDALKLILNSTYGIAAATFDNPLRDPRDINNTIALRGALFMRTLQDEIVDRGFKVIGIRTDSIKIPNATQEIIDFCMEFAKKYGYEFEHECTYERLCLVNESVYIARYDDKGVRNKGGKKANQWSATGAQFQHPYVFKTLFSGEPIDFEDMCETKSVSGGAIYLDMNEGLPDPDAYEEELSRREFNRQFPKAKPRKLNEDLEKYSDEELVEKTRNTHIYEFVGRVGLFYPIKPGCGGGRMFRKTEGKYYYVTGTKGYRWLEAEKVIELHKEADVDPRYHDHLVNEAINKINKFGSYERFVDLSKPYTPPEPAEEDDDPPWATLPPIVPCGDGKFNTCLECPFCKDDICEKGYSLASYVEHGGEGE